MSLLKAVPAGLESLAGQCGTWAGEVAVAATKSGATGPVGQPSAGAVVAIQARVGLSSETLSARMNSNAATLTVAATTYATQDAQSATVLTGVSLKI